MTGLSICEALCGILAVYIGVRWILTREVPIVSEGDDKPVGWLKGNEAIIAGCLAVCAGLYLLAVAFGLARLP
jgi:hypothetical protein